MASRLKELFNVRPGKGNVLFQCYGMTCRVFGATVPVSAFLGEEALTFTAHLPDGQDRGLIAVAVHHLSNGQKVWGGYVIEITRGQNEDPRVFANLDHPWVPEGQQIIQIDHLGIHLTDVASGHRFTTARDIVNRFNARYVPDGNLLVRCLAGLATVIDVRAAAQAQVEEKSARERLAEIEPKLARLEALTAEAGVAVADLGVEYRRLKEIERLARGILHELPAEETLSPTRIMLRGVLGE